MKRGDRKDPFLNNLKQSFAVVFCPRRRALLLWAHHTLGFGVLSLFLTMLMEVERVHQKYVCATKVQKTLQKNVCTTNILMHFFALQMGLTILFIFP